MEDVPWQRVVFDFDGTLAHRPGRWSQALLDVLDRDVPDHGATRDDLRAALRDGFPWHRAEVPHPELCEPEAWWEHVGALVDRAFAAVGVSVRERPALVAATRAHYCDASHFRLFDDSRGALQRLVDASIEVSILSNHVPELPAIVTALELDDLVSTVASSATIGFEKPHPEAFRHALAGDVEPDRCWMVGDNPEADVDGATAAGLRALLVRHPDVAGRTVGDAVDLILSSAPDP